MPVNRVLLEDSNRTVLSPIYNKIIKDIVSITGMSESALVVVHKDMETTLTDNTTNVNDRVKTNTPTTVARRRIQAIVTEDYNEDAIGETAVNQPAAFPIFHDPEISVMVYPLYIKTDISIEFVYVSPSKSEAVRVRDDLRLKVSQTSNINIHDVDYVMIIPEIVEELIEDVHNLKKRLENFTLAEYFNTYATRRFAPITDMSNASNTRLGINERQSRIVGMFDFSGMPEKLEHDNENNNYKVSFTYKLSVDLPKAMVMRYPVMVCNELIPAKYTDYIEDHIVKSMEELKRENRYTSNSLQSLSHFESHRQLENCVDIKLPLNVPLFDEYRPERSHKGYLPLVSFLVSVDEDGLGELMDLKDLGPYMLSDSVLGWIKSGGYKQITSPYSSFLYIGLHQEGRHFDNSVLEVTSDLKVKSRVSLGLYKPVRITISILTDISFLPDQVLFNLKKDHPEVLIDFIGECIISGNSNKLMDNKRYVDNSIYRLIIEYIFDFLSKDRLDLVKKILNMVTKDKYTETTFVRIVAVGYPDTMTVLGNAGIASMDLVNLKITVHDDPVKTDHIGKDKLPTMINRANVERLRFVTVMSGFVVAYRMTDIDRS